MFKAMSVPTGYGKTLCYAQAAAIRVRPFSKENTLVFYCSFRFAIGISLMMDQVSKYSSKVWHATQFVGEAQEDYSRTRSEINVWVISRVLEGEYQLVFISPEA